MFSQLSTLFEHFFCGSSAVLCVGTKQLSINFKSNSPAQVPQVECSVRLGGEGLSPRSVERLIPSNRESARWEVDGSGIMEPL